VKASIFIDLHRNIQTYTEDKSMLCQTVEFHSIYMLTLKVTDQPI